MVDDATVEKELAEAVWAADLSKSTVKTIRTEVASALELGEEFFKTEPWKSRSKSVIDDAIVR
jgi:hypothetical protein